MARAGRSAAWGAGEAVDVAYLVLGLVIGAAGGVYVGLLRGRTGSAQAGAVLEEVRRRAEAVEGELAEARRALEAERAAGADRQARLESAREHFAEQRRQLEEMDRKVRETFQALASAALRGNNEQFVALAEEKLKPLREQLTRYEQQIKELEDARAKAYGGLAERLAAMQQAEERLHRETAQLVAALRSTGAKGRWGEVSLQRIVELAGMTEHCDFEVQSTQPGGRRPDLVVHLPNGRLLAVDSKVNTSAYLDAMNAADEAERKRHLGRFAEQVRATLRGLAAREYWRGLPAAPEFVVMFIPGEAFFSAAVTVDGDLLADAAGEKVILASPTTLIALLLAVQHGWQQQRMAENAERIAAAGRELYERLCVFVTHLEAIRAGIEKTAEAYDKAVGNWVSRTQPSALRLRELGVGDRDLPELGPVQAGLRRLPPAAGDGG